MLLISLFGGAIASAVIYLDRKNLKKKLAAAEADALAQVARLSPAIAAAIAAARPKVAAAVDSAKAAIVADAKAGLVDVEAFAAKVKAEIAKVL